MEKCDTPHRCVLTTPKIPKVHDFLGPELTHVAPFKSFISLLFGAFPIDFKCILRWQE